MTEDNDFNEKVESLEKRIEAAQHKGEKHTPDQTQAEINKSIGMTAGSNFISAIFGGGVVGYGVGYMMENIALWLIIFLFAGFGWGIYRAAKIMK